MLPRSIGRRGDPASPRPPRRLWVADALRRVSQGTARETGTRRRVGGEARPAVGGKLNVKDVVSGALLLGLALFGLYINGGLFGLGLEQHNLGNARRMGPGYMPMLAFWILAGLGALVLLLGLRNGPDPFERWSRLDLGAALLSAVVGVVVWQGLERADLEETNWRLLGWAFLAAMLVLAASRPWRPLAMVHAGMAVFALSLEPLGLMAAIALTVGVAAFGDETHRPLGVLACVAFLCALCWFVFIYELDIRVPVWPTVGPFAPGASAPAAAPAGG